MQKKIEEVFDALQALDMKPTPHNVSIMCGVYEVLREVFNELEGMKDAGTENRSAADSDGRDDH